MIANDQELEAMQERIAHFQSLLRQFRVATNVNDFPLMAGGYIAEIEKMHGEVMEYLSRHAGLPNGLANGVPQPPGPQQPQMPALPEPPGLDFLSKAIQPGDPPAPPPAPPLVNVENINTQDPSAVGASIAKSQRLEMMRFAGRP